MDEAWLGAGDISATGLAASRAIGGIPRGGEEGAQVGLCAIVRLSARDLSWAVQLNPSARAVDSMLDDEQV